MSAKNIFAAILAVALPALGAFADAISAQVPALLSSGALEKIVAGVVIFAVARLIGLAVAKYGPAA